MRSIVGTFGPPKSRAGPRVVPIPAVLGGHLTAHRDRADEKRQPLVFARSTLAGRAGGSRRPFNDAALMARARKVLTDEGIDAASLYVFRHTYGTLLIATRETPKGCSDLHAAQLDHYHLRSLRPSIPIGRRRIGSGAPDVPRRGPSRGRRSGGCSERSGDAQGWGGSMTACLQDHSLRFDSWVPP